MKYLLVILFYLVLLSLGAQNLSFPDSARLKPDSYEEMYSMLYSNKKHFEEKNCPFKKIPLKLDAYLQEHTLDEDAVQEILDLNDDALTFETYLDVSGVKIELGFELSMAIPHFSTLKETQPPVYPLLKLEVESWDLNSKGNDFEKKVLPLKLNGESVYSNKWRLKNGLDNEKKLIVRTTYFMDDADFSPSNANFRGSLTANALYLKNYKLVELSKETKGDTVTIGEQTIVIIDVLNNTMVYEKIGKDKGSFILESPDLQVITTDIDKENLIEATTEGPNYTIIKNNSFVELGCSSKGSSSWSEVPVHVYEFFDNNSNGSLEDFKRSFDFSDKQFDLKSLEKRYHIHTFPTPIEKLVFYSPNYEQLRSFKTRISESQNNFGHLMSETTIELGGNIITTTAKY